MNAKIFKKIHNLKSQFKKCTKSNKKLILIFCFSSFQKKPAINLFKNAVSMFGKTNKITFCVFLNMIFNNKIFLIKYFLSIRNKSIYSEIKT